MKTEIPVYGDHDDRELYIFELCDRGIRLLSYHQQTRKSNRHKWAGPMWEWVDERSYHSALNRPTVIPPAVIKEARSRYMEFILSQPVYIGWFSNEFIYKGEGE